MNVALVRPYVPSSGRYESTQELARGGMGVVYRAIDRSTGRTLALKRAVTEPGDTSGLSRTMLEREYRMLISLRHPYIIEVYDFGVDELGPYYTMELLDGTDLRAKCPVPWREMCSHLRDVASSLALLHSRRLLHCDVSVANIRLTGEGRAKLLDFGTLANFGRNTVIAGSPPGIAPEVLEGAELDQRVDLYALGATAYYALTGRHAYPATMLSTLPTVWAQGRPPPPSTYVPELPAGLDALVMSLLEHDRMARPTSAAEVIDRLEVVAGLTPDRDPRVLRSYLHSTVMVGRDQVRKQLSAELKQALSGRAAGVLIEGASGLGKSYLLEDVLQEARVAGARVLMVPARAHSGPFGVWTALIREAGGQREPTAGSRHTGSASEQVLLALARVSPLVIAIEDLHEADTDSLAALASLAKSSQHWPLLLVATLDSTRRQIERPALRLLRTRFTALELTPFDEKTTYAFVVGLFGEVPAAARLATFLHDHAAGNPQACRAVIDHLIDQGFVRYEAGTWILPSKLPSVGANGLDLGKLADAAVESRIAHWPPALRKLALCLSPQRRAFEFDVCPMLTRDEPELHTADVRVLMGELVREGVLLESQGAYSFARPATQQFFYAQLSEPEKQRQHRRLAEALEQTVGSDPKRTFEIGFHFLRAGEEKKARALLNLQVEASLRDPDLLIHSTPDLWALLKQQREAGASDEDVQFIEGMLVLGAYYVDPLVYDQFGERVLRIMHRTMGFELAARLSPRLGRGLGLTVGLLTAWVKSLFRRPYLLNGGSFPAMVLTFIGVCVSMNAGACCRLDYRVHPFLLKLLEVISTLGKKNALRLLYDQFTMGEEFMWGRYATGRVGLFDQLERVPKTPGFDTNSKQQLLIGLLFGLGMNEMFRTGAEVPTVADRIEKVGGKHAEMQGQFLRWQHQLARGDLSAAKQEEERFDEMTAQFGSRWTTDVQGAIGYATYHLTADVLGLKRALHRIDLVLSIAPGMTNHRRIANAMYEGHRGRPDLALRLYDEMGELLAPFKHPYWALATGHRAECLNTLGRHAESLALCDSARAALDANDREFCLAYQQIEREASIALAGLGRLDEAKALSDQLLREHIEGSNPLLAGLLHLDRARIARFANDSEEFETHARAAKANMAATHNPAAIARVTRLVDVGRSTGLTPHLYGDASVTTLQQMAGPLRRGKAARALRQITDGLEVSSARLYLVLYGRAVLSAQYGDEPLTPEVESELSKLAASLDGELDQSVIRARIEQIPEGLRENGQLLPLVSSPDDDECQLVGMLALSHCKAHRALAKVDLTHFADELREIDEATDVA